MYSFLLVLSRLTLLQISFYIGIYDEVVYGKCRKILSYKEEMMNIYQLPLGPLQTNAYLLHDEQTNELLIIDPGSDGEQVIEKIRTLNASPLAILLTHAHFDHIGAVDKLREHYQIPVYLHKNEEDWLQDSSLNGSNRFGMPEVIVKPADVIIESEQKKTIGSFSFEILETPGHSPGSLSYLFKDEGFVASGDALFYQSIGRTDLPFGDHETLLQSIQQKLLRLPKDTIVAPGHGPKTTIGFEGDNNPFLTDLNGQ